MKTLSSIIGAAVLLCGCSVMHFKNGPVEPASAPVEKWHHNVALSLVEVSKPLDLQGLCDGSKWSMITTEETFITGLAGVADNIVTGLVLPGGLDIWDPQMVIYSCGAK
jgi:hypothetical protein